MAFSMTVDTGGFWFFSSNNVELVIKVVDGRAFNNRFWVFYGALSNVEYTITVTDVITGAVKTYFNPSGRLASVADTAAFSPSRIEPSLDARFLEAESPTSGARIPFSRPEPRLTQHPVEKHEQTTCAEDATSLCLNGGRFRVQVGWRVPAQGTSGPARATSLTSDTGHFWFFSANNVELVVKVVDGRAFNARFWVFYGALSNVEYTITVTDTATGAVKTYTNADGNLASVADTDAF
jgi:hypothetical protein